MKNPLTDHLRDEITAYHLLATVAKRIPHGVICLLSALRFHEFTTQSPPEVWVGIRSGARVPSLGKPMVRFVRYSPISLAAGTESHQIEGVPVRVTIPAKTVADCFKYRNNFHRQSHFDTFSSGKLVRCGLSLIHFPDTTLALARPGK